MNLRTRRLRLRHLGLWVVAGALAPPAMAEVTTMPGYEVPTPPPNIGGQRTDASATAGFPAEAPIGTTETVHDGRLRVQCWQEGEEIIDQTNLRGLSLSAATRQESVTFKRVGDDQPSVFILAVADGMCLIQPIGSGAR